MELYSLDWWHRLISFGLAVAMILSFIWAVAYMYLSSKFVTPKKLNAYCTLKQNNCKHEHPSLCIKLDQMRKEIKVMDTKREMARKDNTKALDEIRYFMGRVDQYIEDSGKNHG